MRPAKCGNSVLIELYVIIGLANCNLAITVRFKKVVRLICMVIDIITQTEVWLMPS